MNKNQIIGTITIVTIIGVTVYAIKKSRELKKAEEDSFGIDEAQHIVESYAEADVQATYDYYKAMQDDSDRSNDMNDVIDEAHDEVNFNRSFGVNYDGTSNLHKDIDKIADADLPIHPEDTKDKSSGTLAAYMINGKREFIDEEDMEDIEDIDPSDQIFLTYKEPQINLEEQEKLRHDPNSQEALDQFINMELADWRDNENIRLTMSNLFTKEFTPRNDGDQILKTKLIDYRVGFFGFGSIHTLDVTIAEILLHYARAATYNIGESVGFWVDYFLGFNELWHDMDDMELEDTIRELNQHGYFNSDRQTHGIFGLTPDRMNEAERIASFSFGGLVTYEIEFNEFLKACL